MFLRTMTACSLFAVLVNPPARANTFKVVICPRSFAKTKPPGRDTAPRTYTIPECGTVTISPAWRMILFVASPLSISSFRLMVIVLFKRGGSIGGGSAEALEAAVADEAGCGDGPE